MEIKLTNVGVQTVIGTHDWERKNKREVFITLTIEVSNESAIHSDHLEDTLDYESLIRNIREEIENSRFYLIERLAGKVMEIVMKEEMIKKARVIVDKPGAVERCEAVSLIFEQER